MTVISVVGPDDEDIRQGATVRWLTMTPWVGAPFEKHVSVPGGRGLGRTFHQGADNRVATISSVVIRNAQGMAFLSALPGSTVKVINGVDPDTIGTVGALNVTKSIGATVEFSITVREVA